MVSHSNQTHVSDTLIDNGEKGTHLEQQTEKNIAQEIEELRRNFVSKSSR